MTFSDWMYPAASIGMNSKNRPTKEGRRARVVIFGTTEPPPTPSRLVAGPLSVDVTNGIVRGVRWDGIEVIRAIDCPIRDENWLTYAPQSVEETIEKKGDRFIFRRRFEVRAHSLSCRLVFTGGADGLLRASAELTAKADFRTNRSGFTLLHPLPGVAGSSVTVVRSDGSATLAEFPQIISARQPVLDIAGLVYSVHGINVSIAFAGDTFEMEDQRNWSDASYKTYCPPLSRQVPYIIPRGETVRQEIEIRLSGSALHTSDTATDVATVGLRLNRTAESFPVVALMLDANWLPDAGESLIAGRARPRGLQLRVSHETVDLVLRHAQALIGDDKPDVDLEIVIPKDQQVDECLVKIAEVCSQSSIHPAHVIALPEAYLRSYQPDGPWPDGPTPREAAVAVRRRFPGVRIGGGMLTNFTELNRCRPDMAVCDYLTHGTTAIVHAADDWSVVESLKGLSDVFASARLLAGRGDYRLGLVSVGMRCNPYALDVVPNPDQIRLPMAEIDPRQRGLFAAAWAVGAVAATERHGVASMALATPVGPFGIVYRRAAWPQPIYDGWGGAAVYPLFHVVRALSQMAALPRLSIRGTPNGVVAIAAETDLGIRLLLANVSGESCDVLLPQKAIVRRLDEGTFDDAITDPGWLEHCRTEQGSDVTLGIFNIAFVDLLMPCLSRERWLDASGTYHASGDLQSTGGHVSS